MARLNFSWRRRIEAMERPRAESPSSDDVTAVTVKGRAHVPEDNLVSLNLPYEPTSIEMASSRGDFAFPVVPRRP